LLVISDFYGETRDCLMKKNKKVTKSDKPFLVLSRRALIGWACFILFVCAWMFVVGVLVGRDTAPIKFDIAGIQKKLEAAKEDLVKKERSRIEGTSAATKDKTKLDFYEALRDDREDTQLDKKKLSPSISKKAEPLPAKKPPRSIDNKADNKNIAKKPPPKQKSTKPPQKSSSALKSKNRPSVKTYTVQAASVKSARDADRLVAELKKTGFKAYRAIGKVPGKGIWYRVRVGDYQSKASARRTLNKLKKAGLKPIVIEK
jgi:cell division protein FtsN